MKTDSFKTDEPFNSLSLGVVIESKCAQFPVGTYVVDSLPWQLIQLLDTNKWPGLRVVAPIEGITLSSHIGALGMPGMTAYFGFLELTNPKPGETVLVSGAAGAVGSLVGQIAKIKGCRAIGVAGTDDKMKLLKERYHFDDCTNYKTNPDMFKMIGALKKSAPSGIDIYFDNTGGHVSDAAYVCMNNFARVAVCGSISVYNEKELLEQLGPRLDPLIVSKQIRKEGFIVSRWSKRNPEAVKQMSEWIKEGKLINDETIVEGIEKVIDAFNDMMQGKNIGKMVVKC